VNDEHLRQVLVHGLQPVTPEIVPYDDGWPVRFAEHRDRIAAALGARARLVEHIGSTSVPGLAAKDVVDVLVGIDDPDDEAAYLPDLRLLREHLRAHPRARAEYEAAKRVLAGREWPDMNHYAEAKGPTIRRLLHEAGWRPND
jgi:GrpB-like predicted nucleotidyltransferase (UPF0157 family)